MPKRKYLREVTELIRTLSNKFVEEYTIAKVKYDDGEYEIDIIVKTVDEQNKVAYQVLCFTPYLARKFARDLQQILRYSKVRRFRKNGQEKKEKRKPTTIFSNEAYLEKMRKPKKQP